MGNYRPTDQAVAVRDVLTAGIDAELEKLRALLETDLPALNDMIRDAAAPAIITGDGEMTGHFYSGLHVVRR